MYILYWGEFKDCRKFSVNFAKPEVSSFTHAQLTWQQKAQGELVWSGCLYEGRWNERVWAKRCDAIDWGLLKQGASTYLRSNLDFERNYTKLPSMWISNFFTAFLFWGNGRSFSGMKTGLIISHCERVKIFSRWVVRVSFWLMNKFYARKLFSLVSS